MKLSSEKRPHEKQQAEDLIIWADWLLYRGYTTIFNEVIRKIEDLGSQLDGVAVQRSDFVSFKQVLVNNFREPDYFQTLLAQLEFLEKEWGSASYQMDISRSQWFYIRRRIIRQIATSALQNRLCAERMKTPFSVDVDKVKIPANFNYSDYKTTISDIFNEHKTSYYEYPQSTSSNTSFILREEFQLDQFRFSDLLSTTNDEDEVAIDQRRTSSNTQVKLSMAKIRDILRDNNVEQFIQHLSTFCDNVEKKVLPTPVFVLEYVREESKSRVDDVAEAMEQMDWSEETKASHGPYRSSHSRYDLATITIPPVLASALATTSTTQQSTESDQNNPIKFLASTASDSLPQARLSTDNVTNTATLTASNQQKEVTKQGSKRVEIQVPEEAALQRNQEGESSSSSSSSRGLTIAAVTANNKSSNALVVAELHADTTHSEEVLTQPEILISSRMATEESAEDDESEKPLPHKRKRVLEPATSKVTSIDEDENHNEENESIDSSQGSKESITGGRRRTAVAKIAAINRKPLVSSKAPLVMAQLEFSPNKPDHHKAIVHVPQKRVKWTADEEIALIEALERYSPGQWANIKSDPDYSDRLYRRTSINIKDKYRDLVKNGKV
mmetsp:Transcript_29446/g.40454  ORF Transcript_29446/g.40454 Transcript_29446/m.40454 type:complete len:613 (+) Transcript_29446:35-1873(+)